MVYMTPNRSLVYVSHENHLLLPVVSIDFHIPFKVLVARIGKSSQYLVKKHVICFSLPNANAVVATKILFEEVLQVSDPKEGIESAAVKTEHISDNVNTTPGSALSKPLDFRPVSPGIQETNPVKNPVTLNLVHTPECHRERVRETVREFTPIWDGPLGTIRVTDHCIDFLPHTRPISQRPYRAGRKAGEKEKSQVQKLLRAANTEPAQCSWASPTRVSSKPGWILEIPHRKPKGKCD